MEELRSTDALDREILEDARRKAEKALRAADEAAREAEESWDKKLAADLAALETKHADRVRRQRAEVFARLPLDQRRSRVERAERLLSAAMASFLGALPRERLLALVEREVARRAAELAPGPAAVRTRGLKEHEASALLSRTLGPGAWTLVECADVPGELPSLTAESGAVTVRCGVADVGTDLLGERRGELAAALLGPEATDD